MRKDEHGYIVVETITSFMLLVLLMASILSLVNLTVVQARIHYAMTQAAETVSMYSYALEVTGVAEPLKTIAERGEHVRGEQATLRDNVNQVLDGLKNMSVNEVTTGAQNTAGQIKGWVDGTAQDPKGTVRLILSYGFSEIGNGVFAGVMRPLVGHYLENGDLSGDEYLKDAHVVGGLDGLEFYSGDPASHTSTLLDSEGNVWLTVRYEIDYTFGALPLPFEPTLQVSQTVKTKAWLGGDGKGYWG